MALSKKQREELKNKYGGRCAYCGIELNGKWHADHAEPVERKIKRIYQHYVFKDTGEIIPDNFDWRNANLENIEHIPAKTISDGFHKPENDKLENMMPACISCNINKHSMNIEEFRRFIGRFINSLNRDSVIYSVAKRYGLVQETGISVKFYFEKHDEINNALNQK